MIEELIFQSKLEELKNSAQLEGIEYIKRNSNLNELGAIHLAANSGNVEIVEFYLNPPVCEDPNLKRINNFTPLHAESMNGKTKVVKLLLDRGAQVNVQTEPQKYSPLHSASFGGHLETVKILLQCGADSNLRNYRDELPIDTARRQNQLEVVRYLEQQQNKKMHNTNTVSTNEK